MSPSLGWKTVSGGVRSVWQSRQSINPDWARVSQPLPLWICLMWRQPRSCTLSLDMSNTRLKIFEMDHVRCSNVSLLLLWKVVGSDITICWHSGWSAVDNIIEPLSSNLRITLHGPVRGKVNGGLNATNLKTSEQVSQIFMWENLQFDVVLVIERKSGSADVLGKKSDNFVTPPIWKILLEPWMVPTRVPIE